MRSISLQQCVLTAVAVLGTALLFALPAQAAGSVGGRPGLPRDDEPRSQSIFIHTLAGGKSAKDKVLLSNRSDEPQIVEVYATDAIATNTGSFTCKQQVEDRTGAGAWIQLARQEVRLEAGEAELVDFTITVPGLADVGEHNACLAFTAKEDVQDVGGNLRIRTRSAVRVAITVPGELQRGINIANFAVNDDKNEQIFTVQLRNNGNVSADTEVGVELQSLFGGVVYENGGQYPVLRGNTLELTYRNDETPFWGGWYSATANIVYDTDAATWGTEPTRTLEVKRAEPVAVFVWPHPLAMAIYIILFGLAVGATLYWWLERRKVQLILNSWQKYTVKSGDTLEEIAAERHENWKLIAKINELQAPYTLASGMKLLVPPVRKRSAVHQPRKKG